MNTTPGANPLEEPAVAVLPHVRVVPAGLDENHRMQLTLLLSADESEGDTGFTLAEWPVAVARHFLSEKVKVNVLVHEIDLEEYAAKGRKLCIPETGKSRTEEVKARRLVDTLKTLDRLGDLARLWNITWAKRTSWEDVAGILKNSLGGTDLRAGDAIRGQKDFAPDLKFDGDQIEVEEAAKTKEVASVLAVPHADLALALEYGRAHELAESMAEPDPAKREAARRSYMKAVKQPDNAQAAHLALFDSMAKMRDRARALFKRTCDSLEKRQCFSPGLSDSWAGRAVYFPAAEAETDGFDRPRMVQDYVSWVQKKSVNSDQSATSGAKAATGVAGAAPTGSADGKAEKFTKQDMAGLLSVLQSTPALARLYGFAVDVTLADAQALADDKPVFYLLSCALAAEVAKARGVPETRPRVWTLACRRGDQFTAASHAELDMAVNPVLGGEAAQLGGHLVMSAGWPGTAGVPTGPARFDITTLALRPACDAEDQRRSVRRDMTQGWEALAHGASFAHGGLTLLDRGAQADAVARLAALDCKMQSGCCKAITDQCTASPHGHVILEAQDLTTGYRMDIGVPDGQDGYRWFTAASRRVRWAQSGDPEACEIVRRLLPGLTGGYGTASRIGLDSPAYSAGVRLVPLDRNFKRVEAAVDEEFMAWSDTPAGFEADLNDSLKEERLLPMGRLVSVLDSQSDAKLPPELLGGAQRYGHAYRVKLRAVFQGGVSVPINKGFAQLEQAEPRLAYPPLPDKADAFRPLVRLLRQSGIGAPQVAMDPETALRSNGAMPPEECTRMVVRSVSGSASDTKARARPDQTLRLLLPPNVSALEASRHGRFSGAQDRHKAMPPGALRGIWMNARGGFRGTRDATRAGMNGVQHYIGRTLADPPANVETPGEPGPTLRNLVLTRDGRPANQRLGRYYPDPAADRLVLRLFWMDDPARPASDSATVAWDQRWPDLPPVAVELIAGRKPGQPMMQVEGRIKRDVLAGQSLPRVRVRLHPGERVFLDAWCLPSAERLAREFAIVQSLAIVRDREGAAGLAGKIAVADKGPRYIGPGGVVTPPAEQVKAVAQFLHETLAGIPLPDIAAPLRLPLIHATDRPAGAAILRDVAARRLSQDRIGKRGNAPDLTVGGGQTTPGATGFVLTGHIELPLSQTGGFQILGKVTLPGRSVFDDEARGRSLAQKRADVWPRDSKLDGSSAFRKAEALFGFKVFADGQVELPTSEVLLLRMDALPPLIEGAALEAPASIPLDACFLAETGKPTDFGRRSGGHLFGDGKARHMILWPQSIARTASEMTMMARVEGGRLVGETPVPEDDMVLQGEQVRVTLPASIRPLPPRALSPFPIFWLRQTQSRQLIELRRSTRIRLPLGRGWFSSGVDERLGIIFWPPELPVSDPLRARDLLPLAPGAALRHNLRDFVDEDLGPGGAYVSRMGADPIRNLGKRSGWSGFAAPSVFLSPAAIRNCEAGSYVASVPVPLSVPEDETDKPVPVLTVALQTFAPRFDAAAETWHVDLDIDTGGLFEPFVRLGLLRYQPHAPLALRASSPVVQWMQPIADRRITLDRKGNSIRIRFEGADSRADRARLQARLLAESTVAGLPERREICRADAPAGAGMLELTPDELDRRGAGLVLFLEEIEQFEPAQYASEPVSPETGPGPADPGAIRALACIRDVQRLFG